MKKFRSILVANRGEIAVRVISTAKSLGYRVIAVYSRADADAPHVKMADESVEIGPGPATESYLCIDKIIDAATSTGAGAIHPGYGFLSENAPFATACEAAGIIFIGPGASAIELMGNKAAAKRQMHQASVPCVPGYEGENPDDETLIAAAGGIGFPLMVKAAAGGGGRGISLVESADRLPGALQSARSVAQNSFGSAELILEQAVVRPRHVEIQVFADQHGNIIHLGERDCSVQRRHQKVLEEAPCPVMTESLRAAMGEAAVEAARAIDYCGAGTVEFLLDESGQFYFLEMNTRLQVEHPVTEMVTGLDMVAMQLSVAQGEPLQIRQEQVSLKGHAIEVRLYAEDTSKGFLPRTGTIECWRVPDTARVDAGIEAGQVISPFYDSMLAKIIVWGENRAIARERLIDALRNTLLFGITSNRDFLIRILQDETFQQGNASTAFIDESFSKTELQSTSPAFDVCAIAAAIQYHLDADAAFRASANVSSALLKWSSAGNLSTRYRYEGQDYVVTTSVNDEVDVAAISSRDVLSVSLTGVDSSAYIARFNDKKQLVYYHVNSEGELQLSVDGVYYRFQNQLDVVELHEDTGGVGRLVAPMHGVVQEVLVSEGDQVSKGQCLLVLEAMKMQHNILSDSDGVLRSMCAEEGQQVEAGQLVAEVE